IVLAPGTETGKKEDHIPDGGQIQNYIDEPTIQSLQGQIKDILEDVKQVTASLAKTVGSDKGQEQIAKILETLAQVTEQLNETVKENRAGVREAINNINVITGQSRPEIQA